MKRCTECLMPETARNIEFDEAGVCLACRRAEKSRIGRKERLAELKAKCDSHRRTDGGYDCILPVSGGKDSFFQTFWIKKIHKMNPLLVSVTDEFAHTQAGVNNADMIAKSFGCDHITLRLNPKMVLETTRWGFENIGSTNWAVDMAIYAWPLQMAAKLEIPFVVYGENVEWEYGCKTGEDTPSARGQILNNVVNINEVPPLEAKEMNCLKYPPAGELIKIDPVYLSYYTGWDGITNMKVAEQWGFRGLENEWDRAGYIDDFWQVDSVGYLMNYHLKYAKYGYSKATDVASHLIRYGYAEREAIKNEVAIEDGRVDVKVLSDFLRFTGYSHEEFHSIMDKWYNKDLFEKNITGWELKREHRL